MARAAVEDGIPCLAIVWVRYQIMGNAALSWWLATIRWPKDLWTPFFEDNVSGVVGTCGWVAQKRLSALGQPALGSRSDTVKPPK